MDGRLAVEDANKRFYDAFMSGDIKVRSRAVAKTVNTKGCSHRPASLENKSCVIPRPRPNFPLRAFSADSPCSLHARVRLLSGLLHHCAGLGKKHLSSIAALTCHSCC